MRPQPHLQEPAWGDGLDPAGVAIMAMNEAEILHDIGRLPNGWHKQSLQQSWDGLVADIFAGLRSRERLARPMATADAVIAATALPHGAQLATCDMADFADAGLDLINPWAG